MEKFSFTVLDLLDQAARNIKTTPLNLGGVGGTGGGVGGPPGGFIGQLPQYRVAYDTLEAATLNTLPSGLTGISGWSLVDNLNHIRYRLDVLESGGSICVVDDNTITSYLDATHLHFSGAGVVINDLGGGHVQAVIVATGSGGGGMDETTANGLYLRLDTTNKPLTGSLDITPGTDDYGIYVVIDGDGTSADLEQYIGAGDSSADMIFMYQEITNTGDANGIFLDGVRWTSGTGTFNGNWIHFEEDGNAKFDVDKNGNVNIPTGSTYNINGTPHTHASTGVYTYNASTTMADPGSGNFRLNNAAPASATTIAISTTDKNGFDMTSDLAKLEGDDLIFIQQSSTPNKWVRYTITATPTNNTTWFQISVALFISSGAGVPASGNDTAIIFPYVSGVTPPDNDIRDIVGGMVSGNTESGISVTYDGTKLNFATTREVLTGNRTYYVRTDGSDSNTGLANNSGGAFLTIQKAINTAVTLDLYGFTVTVQIADGTYTGGVDILVPWLGGNVTIQGNSGTPSNVVISPTSDDCFLIQTIFTGTLTIKDMKLQTTTGGNGIRHNGTGNLNFQNLVFGACAANHLYADGPGAYILATGNYSITGGAGNHWVANLGGSIVAVTKTITITGTPAFSSQFALSTTVSSIVPINITFSGSATGTRYLANLNAVINTNGGGANYLPGNAAGSTATGGQYA